MSVSILFAALLTQAQPVSTAPVGAQRDGDVIRWVDPAHCVTRPTVVDGPAPGEVSPLIAVVEQALQNRAPRTMVKPIWRPQDHPDAGVYAPVVRMVDGCSVPVVKVLESEKIGR